MQLGLRMDWDKTFYRNKKIPITLVETQDFASLLE